MLCVCVWCVVCGRCVCLTLYSFIMKSDDRTQGEPDSDSYYKETTNQIRAHTPHYTIRTTYASKEVKLGKNVRKLQEKENTLDILTVEIVQYMH